MSRAKEYLSIGACVLIVGAIWYWNTPTASKPPPDEKLVAVSAVLFSQDCDRDRPLRITVSNSAAHAVRSITLDVGLFERGQSTNYASSYQPDWDLIVLPGESRVGCVRPLIVQDAWPRVPVLTVKATSIDFYRDGEKIPR